MNLVHATSSIIFISFFGSEIVFRARINPGEWRKVKSHDSLLADAFALCGGRRIHHMGGESRDVVPFFVPWRLDEKQITAAGFAYLKKDTNKTSDDLRV